MSQSINVFIVSPFSHLDGFSFSKFIHKQNLFTKQEECEQKKLLYLNRNYSIVIWYMGRVHRLIRSKRKTLSLEINERAEIIVRAPLKMSEEYINKFIRIKSDWINQKVIQMISKQTQVKKYHEGEIFLYLGRKYELEITERGRELIFDKKFILPQGKINLAEKTFVKWYKNRAEIIFNERVNSFSKIMDVEPGAVKLSAAKKRWGSCSGKNNINLSWRLVMAPVEIIDYVVVHELAHILQKNHSRKFWEIVEAVLPDYKKRRKWLRDYGYLLNT